MLNNWWHESVFLKMYKSSTSFHMHFIKLKNKKIIKGVLEHKSIYIRFVRYYTIYYTSDTYIIYSFRHSQKMWWIQSEVENDTMWSTFLKSSRWHPAVVLLYVPKDTDIDDYTKCIWYLCICFWFYVPPLTFYSYGNVMRCRWSATHFDLCIAIRPQEGLHVFSMSTRSMTQDLSSKRHPKNF